MGRSRENRLQIRKLESLGLAAAFVAGVALTPGTISGDTTRMLATFLGLFSASLLPTITLLVNGMTAGGRSVHAIEKLDFEIGAAMDALLFIFGCTAVAFAGLMALSIDPPALLRTVSLLTSEILPRGGQGIVLLSIAAIVGRAGQIPAILRRTLSMRKDIAIEEARKQLTDNVPDAKAIRASFITHPSFGKTVRLDEQKEQEPH